MEESKEQCAARGGQLAVGRSRPSSCRNPQPTVASHENQEAQCHEQLLVPPPAPVQWSRNPQQRAEDGDAGQCQVQLESPSWRNSLAHFGWEESEWLVPRAETLGRGNHRSLHHGVELCRIRGARKRFNHDWEIGRQGSDQAEAAFSIVPEKIRDVRVLKIFVG